MPFKTARTYLFIYLGLFTYLLTVVGGVDADTAAHAQYNMAISQRSNRL